jgi:N-acetylmuramoyl-L-alanine amidase
VVQLEANPDKYDDFYQNNILRTLALSANLKMSERLAASIENQFEERARRNSRGVKQAGLIVLWAASMPAVLVELGYLTNRFEAAYLNSEQGQDYLASAIFRAVRDFKLEYEKGLEAQNQRVSILESGN